MHKQSISCPSSLVSLVRKDHLPHQSLLPFRGRLRHKRSRLSTLSDKTTTNRCAGPMFVRQGSNTIGSGLTENAPIPTSNLRYLPSRLSIIIAKLTVLGRYISPTRCRTDQTDVLKCCSVKTVDTCCFASTRRRGGPSTWGRPETTIVCPHRS